MQFLVFSLGNLFVDVTSPVLNFEAFNEFTRGLPAFKIPDVMEFALYFFDKSVLFTLLTIEIFWQSAKIAWSIVLRIKSFIPTFGN